MLSLGSLHLRGTEPGGHGRACPPGLPRALDRDRMTPGATASWTQKCEASLERLARGGSVSAPARHAADYQGQTAIYLGMNTATLPVVPHRALPLWNLTLMFPPEKCPISTKERKETAQRFSVQDRKRPAHALLAPGVAR